MMHKSKTEYLSIVNERERESIGCGGGVTKVATTPTPFPMKRESANWWIQPVTVCQGLGL